LLLILHCSNSQLSYIMVYCVLYNCSRETFNALTNWLSDARTLASPNIIIVLVGNKRDLDNEREVTFLEASRFAQENGILSVCNINAITVLTLTLLVRRQEGN